MTRLSPKSAENLWQLQIFASFCENCSLFDFTMNSAIAQSQNPGGTVQRDKIVYACHDVLFASKRWQCELYGVLNTLMQSMFHSYSKPE